MMTNNNTIENNSETVCGIYNVEANVAYLDSGKVLKFRNKSLQNLPNDDVIFNRLNRWARKNGYIGKEEVISIMS